MTELRHPPAAIPAADRILDLLGQMTLDEKLAQIVGFWEKNDGEAVAPLQGEFAAPRDLTAATRDGLGHLTRVYGTRPVDVVERARWLWEQFAAISLSLGLAAEEVVIAAAEVWRAQTDFL